jgi:hypothetical protein
MVKRWDMIDGMEHDTGDYVEYSDYAKLEKLTMSNWNEKMELKARLKEIEEAVENAQFRSTTTHSKDVIIGKHNFDRILKAVKGEEPNG